MSEIQAIKDRRFSTVFHRDRESSVHCGVVSNSLLHYYLIPLLSGGAFYQVVVIKSRKVTRRVILASIKLQARIALHVDVKSSEFVRKREREKERLSATSRKTTQLGCLNLRYSYIRL